MNVARSRTGTRNLDLEFDPLSRKDSFDIGIDELKGFFTDDLWYRMTAPCAASSSLRDTSSTMTRADVRSAALQVAGVSWSTCAKKSRNCWLNPR